MNIYRLIPVIYHKIKNTCFYSTAAGVILTFFNHDPDKPLKTHAAYSYLPNYRNPNNTLLNKISCLQAKTASDKNKKICLQPTMLLFMNTLLGQQHVSML